MPEKGKTPHAGHLDGCPMRSATCAEHKPLQLGCSICHNAAQMLGVGLPLPDREREQRERTARIRKRLGY